METKTIPSQKDSGNKDLVYTKAERQWKQRLYQVRKTVETKTMSSQKDSGNKDYTKSERQWKQRLCHIRKTVETKTIPRQKSTVWNNAGEWVPKAEKVYWGQKDSVHKDRKVQYGKTQVNGPHKAERQLKQRLCQVRKAKEKMDKEEETRATLVWAGGECVSLGQGPRWAVWTRGLPPT